MQAVLDGSSRNILGSWHAMKQIFLHSAHGRNGLSSYGPLHGEEASPQFSRGALQDIQRLVDVRRRSKENLIDDAAGQFTTAGLEFRRQEDQPPVAGLTIVGAQLQLLLDHSINELVIVLHTLEPSAVGQVDPSWSEVCWFLCPSPGVSPQQVLVRLWSAGAVREDFHINYLLTDTVLCTGNCTDIKTAERLVNPEHNKGARVRPIGGLLHYRESMDEIIVGKVTYPPFTCLQIQREVSMLVAAQRHPNIVKFLGLYLLKTGQEASWAIAQTYCEGGDLFELMSKNGPLSEENALEALHDTTKALAYVHSVEIIHRDIKAENVVVKGTSYMLTDFGNASLHNDRASMTDRCGTLGYIAPEWLLQNYAAVSYPVDVFSSGVLLYYLLCFKMPFGDGKADARRTCKMAIAARLKFNRSPYFDFIEQRTKSLNVRMCARTPRERPTAPEVVRLTVPPSRRRAPPPPRSRPTREQQDQARFYMSAPMNTTENTDTMIAEDNRARPREPELARLVRRQQAEGEDEEAEDPQQERKVARRTAGAASPPPPRKRQEQGTRASELAAWRMGRASDSMALQRHDFAAYGVGRANGDGRAMTAPMQENLDEAMKSVEQS